MLNRFNMPIIKAEWLLTRKCNLFCSYCDIAHKLIKEVNLEEKKKIASRLKELNIFPVIYGGEASQSKDFEKLLYHLKTLKIHYALISHGMVDLLKLDRWIDKYEIPNWSVSVDTLDFNRKDIDKDVVKKARAGYSTLIYTKDRVPDRVNCITITKYNIEEVPEIVKEMSRLNVHSILSIVNLYKPGFRYSAPSTINLLPTQKQLENLITKLKVMRMETVTHEISLPLDTDIQNYLDQGYTKLHNNYKYFHNDSPPIKTTTLGKTVPKYLFHEPVEVWDLALKYAIKQDWKCSKLSKLTIDADGKLGCCVDWQGKNYGQVNFLDLTDDNISQIEKMFEEDIKDCHNSTNGCGWFPTMLTENLQQSEKGLNIIKHGY